MYQVLINQIDPTVNARYVEAYMRLQYGTLDNLSREQFVREVALCKQCIAATHPDQNEALAKSFGL
jgi:hypothetical protein